MDRFTAHLIGKLMDVVTFWNKFTCNCGAVHCEPKLHSISCQYRISWVARNGSVHMMANDLATLKNHLGISEVVRVHCEDDLDNSNDLDYTSFNFNYEADPYSPMKVKISLSDEDLEFIRNSAECVGRFSKCKEVKEKAQIGGSHYVYIVSVDGQPHYVGKGSGSRYKHAASGRSSSKLLNKAFFEGRDISVDIFADGLSASEALKIESEQIALLVNKIGVDRIYNIVIPKV